MPDPINRPVPAPLSDEQKKAQAESNLKETEQAHKMAADQRARDAMNEKPLMQTLAESIKEKLEALPPEEQK